MLKIKTAFRNREIGVRYGPSSDYSNTELASDRVLGYNREFSASLTAFVNYSVSADQPDILVREAEHKAKCGLMDFMYSDIISELYKIVGMIHIGDKRALYDAEGAIYALIHEMRKPD